MAQVLNLPKQVRVQDSLAEAFREQCAIRKIAMTDAIREAMTLWVRTERQPVIVGYVELAVFGERCICCGGDLEVAAYAALSGEKTEGPLCGVCALGGNA